MKKYIDEELLQQVILETKQQLYPVGSIYISSTPINPQQFFGFGEWEQIKDTFLVGSGNKYQLNKTGGSEAHQHNYGFRYAGYFGTVILEQTKSTGLLNYDKNNNFTLSSETTPGNVVTPKVPESLSQKWYSLETTNPAHYQHIAATSSTSNLPPYLVVEIWRRVA